MKNPYKVLIGSLVALASACTAAEFHVSPAGKDTNAGTDKRPFATIARAQIAARQARGGTVVVHAGTYYLLATLAFTPEDAGTEYRSANDEKVVISGGRAEQVIVDGRQCLPSEGPEGMRIWDCVTFGGPGEFWVLTKTNFAPARAGGRVRSTGVNP